MNNCDIPEFYKTSEPVARKVNRCCECKAPIEIGEQYLLYTGKWDGDIRSEKQHLLCAEACMLIRDNDSIYAGGECIAFGSLNDYMQEFRIDIRDAAKDGNEAAIKLLSLYAAIIIRERKAA